MLNDLKILLGIDTADAELDGKLNLIINAAKARLKLLLGGIEPPAELEYIILEASVIRFNKIGSEGLSAHTVEGESLSFTDNDFAGFADEIQAYLEAQAEGTRGKVRFI